MHNFELNNGCGVVNYQTQHRAMVDKPAKVTQMVSIVEPSWMQTINVTNGSKQVQSQHRRGLKVQPHPGNIVGGNTHKIRGIERIVTCVVAGFSSVFTAAQCQTLPLWFRLRSRWRREAVRLLTKPRRTQARGQSQSQ